MILEESKKPQETENILPLINVVFLLLIFFVLSGVVTRPELFEVSPPVSISDQELDQEPIQILLSKDGKLAHGEESITTQQFQRLISHAKQNYSNTLLQIKADQGVEMQKIFEIMEIIKAARYENFQLLTLKK